MKKPVTKKSRAVRKGTIKPHEGRELSLMLDGSKPLARFTREVGAKTYAEVDAAFKPYVKRGTVQRFAFKSGGVERIYFCLPTEEWRVKLLELIDTALEIGAHEFTIYDLHRIDGALLGYSKADVEFFIARWRRHYKDG